MVDYVELPFEHLRRDPKPESLRSGAPIILHSASMSVAGFVPGLRNSRYPIEIDWRDGAPSRTSTRSGMAR